MRQLVITLTDTLWSGYLYLISDNAAKARGNVRYIKMYKKEPYIASRGRRIS